MPRPATISPDDVFINCPFDQLYRPLFEALIFAVHSCGFRPRSAREVDDGGQIRFEKLIAIIGRCRYGIHDLSRTELDEENGLPRFNMPLELGLFLGARRFGDRNQKLKQFMILDVEPYRHQKFISDLAGVDVHAHGGDPERAVGETRDWLANVSRRGLPSSARLVRLYNEFRTNLPDICARLEFDVDRIPYVDFERILVNWLLEASPAD